MCQLLQKSLKIIKEQTSSEWEVDSNNDMHVKCSQVYYAHSMHSDAGDSRKTLVKYCVKLPSDIAKQTKVGISR